MQSTINVTPELDAAFDGNAKYAIKILAQAARNSAFLGDTEELFQEFYLFYTRKRVKYDPSRGKPTTFMFQVARSFLFTKRRSSFTMPKLVQKEADVFGSSVSLDADEQSLVDAALEAQGRYTAKSLAKQVGRSEREVMRDLESIREKHTRAAGRRVVVRN
jgi:DNA-directed RNA polymerase specialized sigma24 family protein